MLIIIKGKKIGQKKGHIMKIIVLAGGYSPEREVSLSSGSLIANALMEQGHEVFFLDPWLGIKAGERVH